MSISSTCATWLNATTPWRVNLGSLVRAWRSLMRDETNVSHGARVYIPSTCSLTHVLRTVDWMVCQKADGCESSTRTVADLLWLDNAGGGADSRFISAIRWTWFTTAGQSRRVVATRWPVSGGAWCVPESSRTSGLSAGSGDLKDRRSTADTCLVLLRGVGSPGARGDLCEIVGWQWRTIERRWTFSYPV